MTATDLRGHAAQWSAIVEAGWLEYRSMVFDGCNDQDLDEVMTMMNHALRITARFEQAAAAAERTVAL